MEFSSTASMWCSFAFPVELIKAKVPNQISMYCTLRMVPRVSVLVIWQLHWRSLNVEAMWGSYWTGVVGTSDGLKCDDSCELLPCGKVLCGDAGEAVVCRVGVED